MVDPGVDCSFNPKPTENTPKNAKRQQSTQNQSKGY